MTDQPDLASLTIKDLRQLAGEHHIQNRSKLGKEDLVLALQGVLAGLGGRLAAAAAAGGGGETTVESVVSVTASGEATPSEPIAAEPAPAAPAVEPEVITLGGDLGPAAEPEVLDAAAVADLASPAPANGGQRQTGPDGQPLGEGERRGRRRRRRRGRGRGRRDDEGFAPNGAPGAQGQDDEGEGDDGEDDGEGAAASAAPAAAVVPAAPGQPATQPGEEASAPAPRPSAPARGDGREREPRGDRPRDDREPRGDRQPRDEREPRGDRDQREPRGGDREPRQGDREPRGDRDQREPRGGDREPRGQGQDNRPSRPRLNGQMRAVPSVLDRLCVFTRGILELCDPSTPSWAQARLSELLAEAGLVGMPASGAPHPDFHQVIGTAVAKDLPTGHIAVIEAPGFALRGDRGDLFPLRKAQVRVAGSERRDQAPGERPIPQPVAERPAAAPVAALAATSVPAAEPVEIGLADLAAVPAPAAATPAADAPGLRPDPEAPRQDDQRGGRAPRDERGRHPRDRNDGRRDGRGGERRDGRGPREPRDDQRQGGEAQERAPEDGVQAQPEERGQAAAPHPEQGRPPHYPHAPEPAGDAPTLPLAPQVPEELAARPKAEGFRSLGLNEQILADLAGIGYQQPSPIQAEAIPQVLAGRDVLGQAQTGTGKTAAFALPMLQRLYELEPRDGKPAMLVLCPTRELARQVAGEFTRMAGASGARAAVIYGGVSMDDQVRALDRHPHVVIGTPGRIIDHMRRHTLDLSRLAMAVLDEADQMLDIGFWPDVNYIIGHTPPERQMLLFSATFPDEVKQMAEKHMKNPVHVRIAPKQVTVEQVDQKFIAVPRERKNELLAHFIETQNPPQLVVFCRTKHQTDRVAEVLKRKNMSAGAIHGDLPQTKREKMLQQFRAGELQCLVATNVAARGLDIPTVSHVVNYDIPEMPEEYVHRIGRTARNGARGVARTFITPDDGQFLLEIEKHIGMELEEEKVEGFTLAPEVEIKRTIADMPVGTPRMLKPLVGGIRLGRRRR